MGISLVRVISLGKSMMPHAELQGRVSGRMVGCDGVLVMINI